MAIPFQPSRGSERQQKTKIKTSVQRDCADSSSSPRGSETRTENTLESAAENQASDQKRQQKRKIKTNVQRDCEDSSSSPRDRETRTENTSEPAAENQASDQNATVINNVYCISNSRLFVNMLNHGNNIVCDSSSTSNKNEGPRNIKVRKGVFNSSRVITAQDIQAVAAEVKDDWKTLLKELPGVALYYPRFHQAIVDAMDTIESSNMAEIVLYTWKKELPEYSTIGNLSKTLFYVGFPDIVTQLKP